MKVDDEGKNNRRRYYILWFRKKLDKEQVITKYGAKWENIHKQSPQQIKQLDK